VARDAGGFGPEFDHLALRVELDGAWLADVGFGESFDPVPFDETGAGDYRITADGPAFILFRGQKPRYRFTLASRALPDYTGMCHHHQTSPDSSFTQGRLVTQATADGRVTLTGSRLILTRGEEREEHDVNTQAEFETLCRRYFGITCPLS
jgi:N-hydroxyarylamine O-acetyltransferase